MKFVKAEDAYKKALEKLGEVNRQTWEQKADALEKYAKLLTKMNRSGEAATQLEEVRKLREKYR